MARLAQGRASRTARMTAAMRHRHYLGGAKPLVFEDEYAQLFLDWRSGLLAMPTPLSDMVLGSPLGAVRALEGEVLVRSRYVEDVFEERYASGVRQVIVLGAGFDSMAIKHRARGCTFFEVDHPATQAEKRRILARHPGLSDDIVFVPVDFASDELGEQLDKAGFDTSLPTFVSWLGVAMYLEEAVVIASLTMLATRLALGSELVFDAYPRMADIPLSERPLFMAAKAFTAREGEPMTDWFAPAIINDYLAGTGFTLVEMIRGNEAIARWFGAQSKVIHPPQAIVLCRCKRNPGTQEHKGC
jgi:methyltransferase (TIGR00027 family)